MLSVDEARDRILATAPPTEGEAVGLEQAAGRVPVSFEVLAAVDMPPFANSAMDGFALRAADAPGELRLIGEVAAGSRLLPRVTQGEAVRIATGAPLPPGADTVVAIEDAGEMGEGRVRIPAVPARTHTRPA